MFSVEYSIFYGRRPRPCLVSAKRTTFVKLYRERYVYVYIYMDTYIYIYIYIYGYGYGFARYVFRYASALNLPPLLCELRCRVPPTCQDAILSTEEVLALGPDEAATKSLGFL